jgi:hypothetical protein
MKPMRPFPPISLGRGGDGAPESTTGEEEAMALGLAQRHGSRASGAVADRPTAALAQGRRRVTGWPDGSKRLAGPKPATEKKENRMLLAGLGQILKKNRKFVSEYLVAEVNRFKINLKL